MLFLHLLHLYVILDILTMIWPELLLLYRLFHDVTMLWHRIHRLPLTWKKISRATENQVYWI